MKYFSIQELCKSATAQRLGINNTPNDAVKSNLTNLVDKILEPLREAYGAPIIVSSGYRCEKLNRAVGGSSTSQHVKGEAVDIRSVSDNPNENKKLFDLIRKLDLPFDQLIDEYNYDWVHVSYRPKYRKDVLHARKLNGKTVYSR